MIVWQVDVPGVQIVTLTQGLLTYEAEVPAEQVLDGHLRALADRVGDAGLEADRDRDVERPVLEPPDRPLPHDRPRELLGDAARLVIGEPRIDEEDVAGAHGVHRQTQVLAEPPRDREAPAVGEAGTGTDFDARDVGHDGNLGRVSNCKAGPRDGHPG